MAGSASSTGMNAGCASGPHRPSGTAAERALMQESQVSGATQPCSEHVQDRLIHQLSPEDHAQQILDQVNAIDDILQPQANINGGN
ncbi:hypothetical protein O1611_g6402 [Lasiodiplodia mahajangana]|uniref:Uncharacterized protein n=1 Tax=Lasiodiplodia mahajangana TaxID=1108764 RepID=A0ACC2JIC5_9PEZI|nr:hypothetical protein O1611_g6402 [Lasiodiplodia mahajangana]